MDYTEIQMFIAHAPAGYCLTTLLLSKFIRPSDNRAYYGYLCLGLIASVIPDIDLIYFYLIDLRQHPHHTYMTHIPIYWLAGTLFLWSYGDLLQHQRMMRSAVIIGANVMLHLLLDSMASNVLWLYPMHEGGLGLFHVPSQYGWWVWNYVLHWTFGLEIMIVVAASYLLYYKSNSGIPMKKPKGKIPLCG